MYKNIYLFYSILIICMMKTRGSGAPSLILKTIANTILLSNSFKTFVCVNRVYFLRKEFQTSPHTNSKPSFWIFFFKSSLFVSMSKFNISCATPSSSPGDLDLHKIESTLHEDAFTKVSAFQTKFSFGKNF